MLNIKFTKKHKEVFKKLGVDIVYLFGSYASGKYIHPLSDIDIGVVFSDPEKYRRNTMEAYGDLYSIFTDVLPKEYLRKRFELKAHDFDLVFLQLAPYNFQFNAIKEGKVLYRSNKEVEYNYKEKVMLYTADLQYFFAMHKQAIWDRI